MRYWLSNAQRWTSRALALALLYFVASSSCREVAARSPARLSWQQEAKECANFYFCYRWLLILFKREFTSYEEVCSSPQAKFKISRMLG
jgi:hypothetical protein